MRWLVVDPPPFGNHHYYTIYKAHNKISKINFNNPFSHLNLDAIINVRLFSISLSCRYVIIDDN